MSLNDRLISAAVSGKDEVIKQLIDEKADVNYADVNDWSALQTAAEGGHYKVTQQLIDAKANINRQDQYGDTPLIQASLGGYSKITKQLMEGKANLDLTNYEGWSVWNILDLEKTSIYHKPIIKKLRKLQRQRRIDFIET